MSARCSTDKAVPMADKLSFEQFFENELIPALTPLEERRKAVANRIILFCGTTVAVLLLVALFWWRQSGDSAALIIPIVAAFAISGFLLRFLRAGYVRDFKNEVVGPIVKYISSDLAYLPESGISESRFQLSGIFEHRIDRYHCEDLIQGSAGKTRIEFSELHAEYKRSPWTAKVTAKRSGTRFLKGSSSSPTSTNISTAEPLSCPTPPKNCSAASGRRYRDWTKVTANW